MSDNILTMNRRQAEIKQAQQALYNAGWKKVIIVGIDGDNGLTFSSPIPNFESIGLLEVVKELILKKAITPQ